MGLYYSEDFRLRVLERVDVGMSKTQAHRTFGVSRSTVDDWLRLRDEQGHVRDKPRTPKQHAALSDLKVFGEFAARHLGATLEPPWSKWLKRGNKKRESPGAATPSLWRSRRWVGRAKKEFSLPGAA